MVRRRYDDDETVKNFRELARTAVCKSDMRSKLSKTAWRALSRRLGRKPNGGFCILNPRKRPGRNKAYRPKAAKAILNRVIQRVVHGALLPHSPSENHLKGAARRLFVEEAVEVANHPDMRCRYPFNAGSSVELVPGSPKFMRTIRRDYPRLYAQLLRALKANYHAHGSYRIRMALRR